MVFYTYGLHRELGKVCQFKYVSYPLPGLGQWGSTNPS